MWPFLLLSIISIAPVIMFFKYLRYMDRAEPEPIDLVLKVVRWGAFSIVPVVFVEVGLEKLMFGGEAKTLGGIFFFSFVGIAAVEELAKLVAGLWPVWNDPNFNEENDGIVYVAASSLGFAGLENFFYVFEHGVGVGVLRAVMAVPGHMAWGAMMGYYAGLAKFAPPEARVSLLLRGYLYAVIGHGLYDAFLLSKQPLLVLIMFLAGPIYIWKSISNLFDAGRKLSLQRIASHGLVPACADEPEVYTTPPSVWKLYVARLLYTLSGGFWALILIGIYAQKTYPKEFPPTDVPSALLGTAVLTALPIVLAWLLSASYRSHLARYKIPRASAPEPPGAIVSE